MSVSQQQSAFSYSVPPYANLPIKNITSAYTVQPSNNGFIINCTSGTFIVSLTAAATLGAGFNCWIWNTSTLDTDSITIDPNGAETIDGRSTLFLRRGEGFQIVCNGTNWDTGNKKTMRGYAENFTATGTRPSASGDRAVAIGTNTTASGLFSNVFGYVATASATGATAIGYTANANGTYSLGINADAESSYSAAIGFNSGGNKAQAITGTGAMALGGSRAAGTDSLAVAVANNTSSYGATGANAVAIGQLTRATNTGSIAIGYGSVSTGFTAVALGESNTVSGARGVAIGQSNTCGTSAISRPNVCIGTSNNAQVGVAFAFGEWASSIIYGKYAFASGRFAAGGDAQLGTFVLRCATTDATATVLTTDGTAPGTDDQVILPNNSAYAFTGTVVARRQAAGGTESAAWKIEGLIRREGTAASTTLVASTVTAISNVPGWTLALSADTTNGGLAITATGAAATNIRWLATVQTSEVTYA